MHTGNQSCNQRGGDGGNGFHDGDLRVFALLGQGGRFGTELDRDGDEGAPGCDQNSEAEHEQKPGVFDKNFGHCEREDEGWGDKRLRT
ncbi:hypothetical protein GCM10007100_10800 [Roseibacillus persicicus]|uniref:Uncharacterized protein n=1 Tax=Roseibacillus persicicus TaxID=454148 RepID=A0A918TFI3_9BACT|nr:hypothetical protein GCM10007100_10800 [Roseibacillus persicicus]